MADSVANTRVANRIIPSPTVATCFIEKSPVFLTIGPAAVGAGVHIGIVCDNTAPFLTTIALTGGPRFAWHQTPAKTAH